MVEDARLNFGGRRSLGGLQIDFDRNVLIADNGEHRMEPRIARLLFVLVEGANTVITRDKLIEDVWNGAHGADQSLSNSISQLRKLLAHCNATRVSIETVPKRGYRLVTMEAASKNDEDGPGRSASGAQETKIKSPTRENLQNLSPNSFRTLLIAFLALAVAGIVIILSMAPGHP